MKKLLSVMLCLAMLLTLCACATKTEETAAASTAAASAQTASASASAPAASASATSSAAASTSAASGEPVTLTLTSWRTDDAESWGKINDAFHAEYPNITVEFKGVTATEYDSVLQTKLSSGNAEDIMFLRTFGTGKQIYDAGYVLPITEQNVPNLSKIDKAYQTPWTDSDSGTIYGVPGSMCMGGFFYNKGIFEKCGIANPPATWAEFLQDCQTLEDNGYTAVADGIKDSWFVTEYVSSTIEPITTGGSEWHKKLMNKEVDWTDAGFVKGMEWIQELAKHFPTGYEGIGYDDAQMLFLGETAAIYPSGSFDLAYLQKTNPDIDLGWFFMPVENEGDTSSINFNCIMGYGINAALKDDEAKLNAAYTYLNWLCDDEASSMFNNLVVGQYACNTSVASGIENALAAEILAGSEGCDLYQQMPYEKVSDQSPDYTTVVTEAIYNMLVNGQSAKDVCAKMVSEQAWYFGS